MRQPRDHTRGLSRRGPVNRTTLRLRELERIISLRFPIGILPISKEADVYLLQAAKLLRRNLHDRKGFSTRAEVLERLAIWAERWAHFTSTEYLKQIANHALQQPGIEKADELGKLLALTFEERQLLKITTIGACDVNKAQRARRRKQQKRERDRERAARCRRTKGMVPRSEWLNTRLSVLRPWEQVGISRRTWERRRKSRVLNDAGPASPIE